MDRLKKTLWQIGIYGGVVAYIAADLFLFHGPIARKIDAGDPFSPESIAAAKQRGVVAQVFNHSITRSQVERAARERLWRSGQDYEGLPPKKQRLARYAALDELIDHELLRVKAKAHADKLTLDEVALEARVERFHRRFADMPSRLRAMTSQGIATEGELRDRIAAQMQQEAYVELRVAPLCEVTEEEARQWFEQNRDSLRHPEQVQARHLFLPSLDVGEDEARRQLAAALAALRSGESTFGQLAAELSMDPASKSKGGELGWLTRDRLPGDFAAAVFALPTGQPTLIDTSIGWHLVEVTDRREARERGFQEAREEIVAALAADKRRQAVEDFRKALRRFEGHRVLVFHDMLQ